MPNLTENNNFSNTVGYNVKLLVVQVLVGLLLYVNGLMIFTFLKKEVFWVETRYVLFAQTLFIDSTNMLLSYLMLMGSFYQYLLHIIPCCVFCTVMTLLNFCTPVTLVAMCLERYVAICMPLRHSSISTPKNTFIGLLVIWTVSFVIPLYTLIAFLACVSPAGLSSYVVCSVEVMLRVKWLADTRGVMQQILVALLFCIVVSTYIKIMRTARSASSDNKKSTNKSLKTISLHSIQLFLCIVQHVTPYIEIHLLKINVMLFQNVRYSTYVLFIILPRCLSPLIYGLRDKKFYNFLKHYAFCGIALDCKKHKIMLKTAPLKV